MPRVCFRDWCGGVMSKDKKGDLEYLTFVEDGFSGLSDLLCWG
jgi:hypothetical protein